MWVIIVQVDGVAERLRPNIMLAVFCTTEVQVDHHCARIRDSSFDTVFSGCIVMVATESTVFDTVTLLDIFYHKIFVDVYYIVSAVLINGDAYIFSFDSNWSLAWTV